MCHPPCPGAGERPLAQPPSTWGREQPPGRPPPPSRPKLVPAPGWKPRVPEAAPGSRTPSHAAPAVPDALPPQPGSATQRSAGSVPSKAPASSTLCSQRPSPLAPQRVGLHLGTGLPFAPCSPARGGGRSSLPGGHLCASRRPLLPKVTRLRRCQTASPTPPRHHLPSSWSPPPQLLEDCELPTHCHSARTPPGSITLGNWLFTGELPPWLSGL